MEGPPQEGCQPSLCVQILKLLQQGKKLSVNP